MSWNRSKGLWCSGHGDWRRVGLHFTELSCQLYDPGVAAGFADSLNGDTHRKPPLINFYSLIQDVFAHATVAGSITAIVFKSRKVLHVPYSGFGNNQIGDLMTCRAFPRCRRSSGYIDSKTDENFK